MKPSHSAFSPAEPGKPDTRRHNLPVQTTPFIGRERELAELGQLLKDPDVRLVTVLGAGGMGKTRLALEIGDDVLDKFQDGVFFVSLARLRSAELIAPSIIQALGIEFVGGGAGGSASPTYLKKIVLRNLRRKEMLLILDNFEHLLDSADLIGEIIQTAPGVKILVTSRARLNVGGEHRFQVGGMAYPENIQAEEAQKYSAIKLFMDSSRRARSDFSPNANEMKYIVKICNLVDGMPLGIRLAAAWVETLSPEEIATEIVQSLDLLETELRDIPERHRSIRALFDHSWRLLSVREQDVFQSFSVFQGGCTREAAQEITGATLRDLRSLVNKSLLQRTLNGRYEIHELSREYAAEKLDMNPESRDAVHSRHSALLLRPGFRNGEMISNPKDKKPRSQKWTWRSRTRVPPGIGPSKGAGQICWTIPWKVSGIISTLGPAGRKLKGPFTRQPKASNLVSQKMSYGFMLV